MHNRAVGKRTAIPNRKERQMDTRKRVEARDWIQKAIASYESLGAEKTLRLIGDPKGPFIDGESYIFALDIEGKLLAHPYSKELVGRNLMDLRDSGGKNFIEKLLAKARNRGYGFVEYMWPFPNTEEELRKTLFFQRVDGMVLCSGFYTAKRSFLEKMLLSFGEATDGPFYFGPP
jgi:hypothetical protein